MNINRLVTAGSHMNQCPPCLRRRCITVEAAMIFATVAATVEVSGFRNAVSQESLILTYEIYALWF